MTKIVFSSLLIFAAIYGSSQANANEEKENEYLIQIKNQFSAIKQLIASAELEQPHNARFQFHYHKYKDVNNILHPGLYEDITKIEQGINAKFSRHIYEPRDIEPISGDYYDK